MTHPTRRRGALLASFLAAVTAVAPAVGQDNVFQGKTVVMVVAYPPGGGYDAYGRLYAKHVAKHIAGGPTVIVRNMPGASGLVAANYLYNKAPKDGTNLAIFSSSATFAPLFGNTRAQFQTEKFTWIGVIDQTTSTCASWHTSGLTSFDDLLRKKPAIFGAAAATALNSEHPRAFNALLGTRIRVIHGYVGGTSILLAMQRGEVQAQCSLALSSLLSVRREDLEAKRLIPLIQTGLKRHPAIADVPNIYEFAKTAEERQIFAILFGRHAVGRPVIAPPGLAQDRTKTLRAAFDATIADPAFIAEANKQNLPLDSLNGAETEALVAQMLATPPAIVAKTLKLLEVGKVETVKLKVLDGTIAARDRRGIEVKGADGTAHKFRVSSRDSAVTIGGKEAEPGDLKAGLNCRFEHFGEGDIAAKIDCK